MTQEPKSEPRRRLRSQQQRSKLESWLRRVRKSKRAQRKLLHLAIIVAAVLFAFVLGFYYLGPSFTFSGDEVNS
jgi:hypothetical protein